VDRPDAPEPPIIRPNEVHSSSCTVTYQPPERDGGAPVTGYILQRRTPGPDSEWIRVNDIPVTDLQYTIDNLTPATEYEFRVAAVNKSGEGVFSRGSSRIMTVVIPPGIPGCPEVIEVIGTSVRLQWTAPHSNGGADIIEYIAFLTSEETISVRVPADTNTGLLISHTIRNQLQPRTEYRVAVAAVNSVGQGPWSYASHSLTTFAGTLNGYALLWYCVSVYCAFFAVRNHCYVS